MSSNYRVKRRSDIMPNENYKYELVVNRPDGSVSILRTNDKAQYDQWCRENNQGAIQESKQSTRMLLCD